MKTIEKNKLITTYFNMWVKRDFSLLDEIFSSDIFYSECYGPEYKGLTEVHLWIDNMLKKQQVLEWNIKQYIHQESIVVVEWYFKDKSSDGEIHGFNGVSIIEFQEDGKISSIKEFSSVAEHIRPFRSVI